MSGSNTGITVSNECVTEFNEFKIRPVGLVELDLSYTLVSEWGEVMEMCAHLPKLERFQLSHNRFKPLRLSPISTEMDVQFPHLHALILHNTALPWSEVLTICSFFPALEELHFSLNKLQKFDTDHNEKGVSTSMESEWERLALLFPSLRVLNLTENEIDDWTQVSYFKCLPRCGPCSPNCMHYILTLLEIDFLL
jgi:Leucine-rich repeat (LRR) protein